MNTNPQSMPCDAPSRTLRERLMSHLVQPVPDGLALCEFSCSKTRCSEAEWTQCRRRIDSLKHEEPAGR
jgi:hypothetical protein